ncbi:cytochrome c3 family protein [Variovorax sp. RA8]|uniref:cytochrome c3 family protein n=1 Tax=Variovorax sp. (strain JCM 16519 / RA8) TaxID=662548 RepID=UPI000AF17B4A|nr:cytochrome c3 family protein [Variovorax sp. RA8]VTU44558.1 Class III cytochrome C family protein [Variovorax sp. RA8]
MSKAKFIISALATAVIAIGIGVDWSKSDSQTRTFWQQAVAPGTLSQSHAFLANNCAACHTPVKGVEPKLCIACHADNTALLQRQPTAFHANVQICSGCHVEHQGTARMPTTMDHALLARTGHREMKAFELGVGLSAPDVEAMASLLNRLPRQEAQTRAPDSPYAEVKQTSVPPLPINHPRLGADESMLNCASCHATKDRHQGFFGTDCVQCHATTQWTIAEFVHPSARSTECAQCHKPPPSHNMMHFSMMSAPLARQPNAKVNQCFLCHQTTVWNDIKGLGWKKVH